MHLISTNYQTITSKITESVRMEMALDWVNKEVESSGTIARELEQVNVEIEEARFEGRELSFLKEKRHILLLALYKRDHSTT